MKESETDEILFSNISYLKQFRLNKMGAEVVISDRFLISKFLKGLTHCAMNGRYFIYIQDLAVPKCALHLFSFFGAEEKSFWVWISL